MKIDKAGARAEGANKQVIEMDEPKLTKEQELILMRVKNKLRRNFKDAFENFLHFSD